MTSERVPFEYLRVSVTDRCNLRCVYCMPVSGVPKRGHGEILRYEELYRIVCAAVAEGVFRVRITGGEPLVRKGISGFVHMVAQIAGLRDLAMTTNAIRLAPMAQELKTAGLHRVNISLDSLQPQRYEQITRGGCLSDVLAGIDAALEVGLSPVKINVVLVPGVNDDEVEAFGRLAAAKPVQIRFIERMPFAVGDNHAPFITQEQLQNQLQSLFHLIPSDSIVGGGPANVYRIDGGAGCLGFISPRTRPFCRSCTRLRLTSSGRLMACLDALAGVQVREKSEAEIRQVIQQLGQEKKAGGKSCAGFRQTTCASLSDIGG
ncbi:MAG TPA: GTP 3',8-cyclase MoaA [Candidatus Ozemobacteraceae bacterium]|nr:GTP 3',8-cyclase MoaA [Candidatus Ozemobacteraceae bacterium]